MNCPACGAVNAPERLVCAACGAGLEPAAKGSSAFHQADTAEREVPAFGGDTPNFGGDVTEEIEPPTDKVPNLALRKEPKSAVAVGVTAPTSAAELDGGTTDPWNPRTGAPSREDAPDFLGKRFELIELLGEGGMAQVYHARDLKLGEEIAVKMVRAQGMGSAEDVTRFKREILAARRISHPNVIRIHDFGEEGEESFISMELLTGGTLSDRIEAGPIPVDEAIRIAIGIAEGLSAAHAQQIIHRDLKPDNILFNNEGVPKIVDFGIARLSAGEHTQTLGGFRGTPYYMSPEQADGREVTARSDVYSLGVVLYELFTGSRPFVSESLAKLAMMHVKDRAPRLRSVRPDLPRAIEEIVMRALEKRPERRYPDASAVADDLRKVRDALAAGSTDISVARPRGGRGLRMTVAVGVALLLAAVGYLAFTQLGSHGERATPTPVARVSGTPVRGAHPRVAAHTPTPVAARTARPTARPKATPVRARIRATPTPSTVVSERIPTGPSGTLTVTAAPWATVYVNGRRVARETPYTRAYAAGRYRVRMVHPGLKFDKTLIVSVEPGNVTSVWADARTGRMIHKVERP